ncbi:MAG: DNA primase [Gammaproteobacteria bacterium]
MAGRIPQNFIDDLLTRIDIIDVIDGYVPLRKAGRNHQARCPFHDEKTPSFSVSQEKQFYHCFGCGVNGTAITFLMEYGGMDFIAAIEDLASRAGMEVPHEGGAPQKESGHSELYELMEMVVRFYCRQLREHPQAHRAIDYLTERGISGELAAEYELGFAPPGWDNLLRDLGGSESAQDRLAKTGMTIKKDSGSYYDRFRDRIVYPIRDQRGRAIGFGGRVLDDGTPKYLNSPETPIFHKGRELYGLYQARRKLKNLERLYIVEGYMDVLALAEFGIHNVVATLGTAVTQDHLDRLFRICPQLVFCFDGDNAGRKAAWRALEIALPMLRDGRQAYYMFMPEGEDPDNYVRTHGREKFEDTSTHVPLSDFLIESLKQNIDLSSREGRALLAEKSIPYLSKLPANALRELLLKDVAAQSELPIEELKRLLQDKQSSSTRKINRQILPATSSRNKPKEMISKIINYLLQHPTLALSCKARDELSGINIDGMDFVEELLNLIDSRPGINCAGILEHWRNSRYERRLNELALEDIPFSDLTEIEAEFRDIIAKIKHINQKKQRSAKFKDVTLKDTSRVDELRRLYPGRAPSPDE